MGGVYAKMVKHLMTKLKVDVLYRADINFNIGNSSINSMLGRTAHFLFLDDEEAIKMLVNRYRIIFS